MQVGTKLIAKTTRQSWKKDDILEYRGTCDDPAGFVHRLIGGKPNNLPGETILPYGTHRVFIGELELHFEIQK